MSITSHIYNAANRTIAKNGCQSYFKKFEVLFSRKQQSAITDWKILPCIFYQLCIAAFFKWLPYFRYFQQRNLLLPNSEDSDFIFTYVVSVTLNKSGV